MEKMTKQIKHHFLSGKGRIFNTVLLLGISLFFISGLISRGYSYYNLFQSNRSDYFMDFFNPLSELLNGPYSHGSIYPPLPALFYKLLLRMVPFDIASHGAFSIRASQAGEMVFLFYTLLTLFAFFILVFEIKKGSNAGKHLFSFLLLFSGPFLFTLERGNIIFVALLFLIVFVFFKDSKKPFVREFALISLAIAAAVKLYPVIFLILLFKEKRFAESIRVIIYGLILFFIPFFAIGGVGQFPVLLKNISTTSNDQLVWGVGYSVNIQSFVRIIGSSVGNSGGTPIFIGRIISYSVLLIGLIAAYFTKSQWRTIALLTLLMILVPAISFEYSLIFMIIPLILFLDSERKQEKYDYLYLICFLFIFIPFVFGNIDSVNHSFGVHARPLTYGVLLQNISLLVMNVLLLLQIRTKK